jgi:5-methylcytosine-specific restriction protein A
MPTAPPRICSTCGVAGCPGHRRPAWTASHQAHRLRGRRLQQERARLFQADPLCAACARQGRVTIATIRDHIQPLAEGGLEHPSNIQGLCAACHDAKTQREAARGTARNHWWKRY